MGEHRSSDATLIAALRTLARDIVSDDGVANAAISEAACRLEELTAALLRIASVSPALAWPGGQADPDRCACCRALIDEARDALGHQRRPAAAGAAKPSGGA